MKRLTISFALVLFLAGSLFSGAFLDFFQGRSDGSNVTIEWKTRIESNLLSFEIQRRAGTTGEYVAIATVDPRGSNSFYSFLDRSAYKQAVNIYMYRLRIVEENGSSAFSNEITVSHGVNSVKRTWGSIKAMFR